MNNVLSKYLESRHLQAIWWSFSVPRCSKALYKGHHSKRWISFQKRAKREPEKNTNNVPPEALEKERTFCKLRGEI